METRFLTIGESMADRLCKRFSVSKTPEIVERCVNFKYSMFRADMSDSYQVTLSEQATIVETMKNWILLFYSSDNAAVNFFVGQEC